MGRKKDAEKKMKTSVYFEPIIHTSLKYQAIKVNLSMNDLINQYCKEKLIEIGLIKEFDMIEITPENLEKINNHFISQKKEIMDVFEQLPRWFNRFDEDIKGHIFTVLRENGKVSIQMNHKSIDTYDLGFDKDGYLKIHNEGEFLEEVCLILDFICFSDRFIDKFKKRVKRYEEVLTKIVSK